MEDIFLLLFHLHYKVEMDKAHMQSERNDSGRLLSEVRSLKLPLKCGMNCRF